MRIFFIILLLIYIFPFLFAEDTTVTISKTFYFNQKGKDGKIARVERIENEIIPADTEQIILSYPIGKDVSRITGVENLRNLKRLIVGWGLHDYTFIPKLKNLEILIFQFASEPVELDIIKELPKLRLLDMRGISIVKEELDLINNKKLEFICLDSIRSKNRNGMYEISIKNVPESLKYIDLHISAFIIINERLLDSLNKVNCIVPEYDSSSLENSLQVNNYYLKKHPNIHIRTGRELLPEKYRQKQIYALFGLDEDGKYLSTGKYPNTSESDKNVKTYASED